MAPIKPTITPKKSANSLNIPYSSRIKPMIVQRNRMAAMPQMKKAVPWYFSLRVKKLIVRRGPIRSVIPQRRRRFAIERQARSKNSDNPRIKKSPETARKPAPNSGEVSRVGVAGEEEEWTLVFG
jgi:hypothetical protein